MWRYVLAQKRFLEVKPTFVQIPAARGPHESRGNEEGGRALVGRALVEITEADSISSTWGARGAALTGRRAHGAPILAQTGCSASPARGV